MLVQGELVADLPRSECPHELRLIAFKVKAILPKETPQPGSSARSTRAAESAYSGSIPSAWSDFSAYSVVLLQGGCDPRRFFTHEAPGQQDGGLSRVDSSPRPIG